MDVAADSVLADLGPRIRVARAARGLTLAELSERTDISVSTLSRLESGRRRATLELLLPVATALSVSLDHLVAAPADPDPRVVRAPITCDGMTVIPLSGTTSGIQAFHHTIPAGDHRTPDLRRHDGYEWLYVLRGHLRLRLGASDLTLAPGESAEFDTQVPHWFGNAGPGPVRYLTIFGPQGERAHLRARPRRT